MKNDPSMNDIKNKFRGIVSVYRSQQFVKDKKTTNSIVFRQSIKSLYMDCRVKFSEGQFSEVFSWINNSINSQLPELANKVIGFEDLRFITTGIKEISLSTEVSWIVNRLSYASYEINKFLGYKKQVEKLVLLGEYQQALDIIDKKENELGVTLWSVKLKISLLQTVNGLEAQKQYTAEVRKIFPSGILSYISYFTSVRNEDRTSIAKFNADMEVKFNGQKMDQNLVAHLKYHLTTELPIDNKNASKLLMIEQLGTIFDLYETFVAVILSTIDPHSIKCSEKSIIEAGKKLNKINDPRIAKLIFNISGSCDLTKLQIRNPTLSDKFISNDKVEVLKIIRKFGQQKSLGTDIWDYIYIGIWLGLVNKKSLRKQALPHYLPQLLGNALSEKNMLINSNVLIKLSINYHGLSIFVGVKEFLNFLLKSSPKYQELWSPHLISLHSDYLGVEDIPLGSAIHKLGVFEESVTNKFWTMDAYIPNSDIEAFGLSIIKTLKLLSENDYESSLRSLPQVILKGIPHHYRLFFSQMKLFALSKEGLRSDTIKLINEIVPTSKDILDIVTFEEVLIDFEFDDFNSTENILNAPISLFVVWLKTDDSKLLSYLRVATKQAIKKSGVNKPSELDHPQFVPIKSQLIFFLEHICVPQIIDNIRSLRGTKAVLNERQDICRLLVKLDPINTNSYLQEVNSIADDLLMEEGKRVVDRTRIYVDMDAHTRWMFKELKEDYGRYKDLLEINIKGEQNFSEILDDFMNADIATKTTFIPENEADAVLLSLVAKASNDFLTNPKYGLDYFLSKRIRHQSFIGLIRSHLEFSNLITTRVSEKDDFEYNYFWVNKFNSLQECEKDELNDLLSSFAKNFDNELIHVRDNVFQLHTEDCPTGLIKIDFNIQVMSLLKHFIVETDASFEDFVYYSNNFMWAFLQPSLENTKKYINGTLKPSIMHSADKLKAQARKLAGKDDSFGDFELQLSDQTAAVQRSLEDVMSWFTPLTGVSADNIVLSIEKVLNLSIKAALDMLKPFEPQIKTTITNKNEVMLHQQGLTFVNDTIFILLDNIKTHSGLKYPNVNLDINIDNEQGTLTISCRNDSKQIERVRLRMEIDTIKKLIDNEKFGERAKSEGRSGFIKLAASIDKTEQGKLDFSLDEAGEFCLSITIDLGVKQVPVEEVRIKNV